MSIAAEPLAARPATADTQAPGVWTLALIFWSAFAAMAVATVLLLPDLHLRHDPDSQLRLVQVRDLIAGQGWYDHMQRRFDPPNGILMHWSRFIDAPIAALVLFGDLFGNGERFAEVAWPLILFLGFLSSALFVATALGGASAAAPAAILALLFIDPILTFLPGNTDHHNAQLALMLAALGCTLRMQDRPLLGLAAGALCALMLAIGLETLPYVAAFGAFVALRWAASEDADRGTWLFAIALGGSPALLYLAAGSPNAAWACDSLSWAYAAPLALAGFGLASLVHGLGASRVQTRLVGLGLLLAGCSVVFASASPQCLAGPYGAVSPELKSLWLDEIGEAQPFLTFAAQDPAMAIALVTPALIALALACLRVLPSAGRQAALWALPTALIAIALALSFYQVRTLPYANALTIPVLGVWLAQQRVGAGNGFLRRRGPVIVAFLLALPLTYLALGWAVLTGLSQVTGVSPGAPDRLAVSGAEATALTAGAEDCIDFGSRKLLAGVPAGLVLAPVFYGPAILTYSPHQAIAGPYHRAGGPILETIRTLRAPPDQALRTIEARGVNYLALCTTATESARTLRLAPEGLAARLLSGAEFAWLQPVAVADPTNLRLWRVSH